ncbi:pyridoxine 5'-phosphate synthase [candidate division KSB1 bacterium]|nr:pyridoxine 5'-phosphate synthase [candidate division KSB1 bacterium]
MRLGVNVDHVATVRQARGGQEPDPVAAALLVELAGADGIVCHLREDRRHINDRDLDLLKKLVKTHLNLEMAATEEMVAKAMAVKPDMVTLVPERREELTTEGGLDVVGMGENLVAVIGELKRENIVVSLFIDPEIQQVKEAARVGADFVELHTGPYANSVDENEADLEAEKLESMAIAASKLNLGVSAGHGLNYQNVPRIAQIELIEELNIGHSIISKAVFVGLERAVKEIIELIRGSIQGRIEG